jgi:hypothetical protein
MKADSRKSTAKKEFSESTESGEDGGLGCEADSVKSAAGCRTPKNDDGQSTN